MIFQVATDLDAPFHVTTKAGELASQLSICGNGDPTDVDRNDPSVL